MVKTKGNQQTVQETNDHSILSKASIAEHGYFDDPYLKLFCTRLARRAPLIHRGYYVRAKAIDHVLTSFLRHCGCRRSQIVSIGAGFDASYFRLKSSNLLKGCVYYDVDFPDVIRRKHNIIEKQTLLTDIIDGYRIEENVLKSKDYYTLSCDVTDLKRLEFLFRDNNVDFDLPTLFFSECALTYVEYEDSKKLCKFIQNNFPNVLVVSYEQINPHDAFGDVMLRHFEKIQSPLERIHQLSTLSKQVGLFQDLGFTETVGFDMNRFYETCVGGVEKSRMEELEVFDEFEEWHLKCGHYCIVAGLQGNCTGILPDIEPIHLLDEKQSSISLFAVTPIHHPSTAHLCHRYGHACTRLNPTTFLCTGGFGVTPQNQHNKLNDGFLLTMSGDQVEVEIVEADRKAMYHSVTAVSEDVVFVFGGRVSPKQPLLEYGLYRLEGNQLLAQETFQLDGEGSSDQPQPRWRHRTVKVGDAIFISAGRSIKNQVLDDLWTFNLTSKQWKLVELSGGLLPCCHTHSMDVWNDSLVMYGGLSTQMKTLNQLTIVKPSVSDTKTHTAEVEVIEFPVSLPPRYSHSSHVANDNLYVIGGIDPSRDTQPPILVISLVEKTWSAVHMPAGSENTNGVLMLHNHCSVMVDDGRFVVVGGGGNCFSFGTHFNQQLYTIDIPSTMQ